MSRDRTGLDDLLGRLVVAYLKRHAESLRRPVPSSRSTVADEVEALQERLARLARLAASGDLSPEDFAAACKPLRASLTAAEARLVQEAGRPASLALAGSEDVEAAWQALDLDGQRAAIRELIEAVKIGPAPRGRGFQPAGVSVEWRQD